MTLKEKIILAKQKGVSIKLLSELSNIKVNTLYAYSCGQRNLSPEKEEKINNILNSLNINLEEKNDNGNL